MFSIERDVLLAPYTTFGIGGFARYFARVTSVKDCVSALNFCEEHHLPFFILGGGSNILVSDNGFDGCVIKNEIDADDSIARIQREDKQSVLVQCSAGIVWDEFVRFCSEKGFAGLEPLSGIPGTVGAAPVQNIGAYGMSVCDVIESVEVLDTHTKETTLLTRDQCDFSYRSSMFKTQPNRFIILAVVCKLARRARAPIPRYHDILQCIPFAPFGVSLKKLRKTVLDIRANKGMTCKEDEKQQKSAGSFFQNPVVSQKEYESISQKIDREKQKEHMPWYWQLPDGRVKIAAAFLMEQAGYKKGYQAGGAGLSPYHALAVVNYGAAGARDIILLAREIQHTVFQMYGIFLETEIQCIGFENNPFGKDGVIARR